jgi:hypothetical protein
MILGLSPVTCMYIDQLPKGGAVVMVLEVSEFVEQHVVDASAWGFDQVRVQDDLTSGRATSPLA